MPLTHPLSGNLPRSIARGLTEPGGGGGASFDPASLFAGGEAGGWYDPSDLSTMFQDTAGTVPVTTAGQTVARINDKSGRGNNLTQATAANRPTYQVDGGGKAYLQFDGTNDRLNSAGTIGILAPTFGAFIGFQNTAAGTQGCWGNGRYFQSTNSTNYRFTTVGILDYAFAASVPADTNVVMTSIFDAAFDVTFRKNGAAGTVVLGTSDSGGAQDVLSIGSLGAGSFMAGRIYQLIIRAGTITAEQTAETEQYIGGKTGVFF